MPQYYDRTSHLRNTPFQDRNLGLYVPALTPNFNQATRMVLDEKYHNRPDLLAYDLYDNANFWWVFTLFNRNTILDPIKDLRSGMILYVPTRVFISGV